MREQISHLPVLQETVVQMLNIRQGGIYVDATVGLGGHAEAILTGIGSDGRLIGIDRDAEAILIAQERLSDSRVTLIRGNFSEMEERINAEGITAVDGILFDLGISSLQVKSPWRGFSFTSEAPLDMRMDRSQQLSARDIVNRYPEKELERIFREFGEERFARKIARVIVERRVKRPIEACSELSYMIEKICGKRGRIHPATRVFQALRIAVNRELDELMRGLHIALRMLRKGGRLCVIAYHSLEDRIVKRFIADNARAGLCSMITRKPITPEPEEMRGNPSSRSAKLRVAEKI